MVPRATYRFQFNKDFRFEHALALVDYLAALGISHVYASPLLKSRTGSSHGYDVVDPTTLDPELGTADEFRALVTALHERGMGLLLDIVPNHMAADIQNPWWHDVLRNGRQSPYADYFDIAWDAADGKIRLPLLGESLEEALANDRVSIDESAGDPVLRYADAVLPLAPGTAGAGSITAVLKRQNYVIEESLPCQRHINYRRFFDVCELVSLREENPDLFVNAHALVLTLLKEGLVDGLRVDHVDGLFDPGDYLRQLHEASDGVYTVVEKILALEEAMPRWPVNGTTGYEFLVRNNGLFIDGAGLEGLRSHYAAFTGDDPSFEDVAYESKLHVMEELFPGEVDSLIRDFVSLANGTRLAADALRSAMTAVMATLRVYRTYTSPRGVHDADRAAIDGAITHASARDASLDPDALDFLRRVLTMDGPADAEAWLAFVMRWQQYTGPITAKGVEDTAFYRYNVLLSANEVGGNPGRPVTSLEAFHAANAASSRSLNTTSTHDTKRSEDVRARLNVLSELPDEWVAATNRWRALNAGKKTDVDGSPAPHPRDEYAIYQLLAGAWPLEDGDVPAFRERLHSVLTKTLREAKLATKHLDQNPRYEDGAHAFLDALFDDAVFLEDCCAFQERLLIPGAVNSLAEELLKVTLPGVPDVYRGNELWDFSLVDPDNRRPVDFALRQRLLASLDEATPEDLLDGWQDGRIKMRVLSRSLGLRRDKPDLFADGDYIRLMVSSAHATRLAAYARRSGDDWAIVAAPRLTATLTNGWPIGEAWGDTLITLPDGAPTAWRDVLADTSVTGDSGSLRVASVLGRLPVALLVRDR